MLHGLLLELAGHHRRALGARQALSMMDRPRAAPRGTTPRAPTSPPARGRRPRSPSSPSRRCSASGCSPPTPPTRTSPRRRFDTCRRATAAEAVPTSSKATVTFTWGGDTVLGSSYRAAARRGTADARSRRADLSRGRRRLGESRGGARKREPRRSAPARRPATVTRSAPRLRTPQRCPASGVRIVNLANNHADDYGAAGQASTLAALRAARVAWDGKPGAITYLRVKGLRVAFLGFAPYKWAARLENIPAAVKLVRRAAAHADLVVVAIHAGAEGSTAVTCRKGTKRSSAKIEARAGRSHTR